MATFIVQVRGGNFDKKKVLVYSWSSTKRRIGLRNQIDVVHAFRALKSTFFILIYFTNNINEFKCLYIFTSLNKYSPIYLSILGQYGNRTNLQAEIVVLTLPTLYRASPTPFF